MEIIGWLADLHQRYCPFRKKPELSTPRVIQHPAPYRRLLYIHQDRLVRAGQPREFWRELGCDALVVANLGWPEAGADYAEYLNAARTIQFHTDLPYYLSMGSTARLYDTRDNRRTLYEWDDDASWQRYTDHLERIARALRECGGVGILMDSEFYGIDYPRQDPAWAWTPHLRVSERAEQYVDAIQRGFPGAQIGQHVIYQMERSLGGYVDWWTTVHERAAQTFTLLGDTFFHNTKTAAVEAARRYRREIGAGPISLGWIVTDTESVTTPIVGVSVLESIAPVTGSVWVFINNDWSTDHRKFAVTLRRFFRTAERAARLTSR